MQTFVLSTAQVEWALETFEGKCRLKRWDDPVHPWLGVQPTSSLFAVTVNGQRFDAHNLLFEGISGQPAPEGIQHAAAHSAGPGFQADYHIQVFPDTALLECWLVVRNTGVESLQVTRLDSFSLDLPLASYELLSFSSDWGREFEPSWEPLGVEMILETRTGRSSKGRHPWISLLKGKEGVLSGSIAWSGNWIFRFEPKVEGGWQISGGLNDWQFASELQPGQDLESPHVVLVLGHDLNAVSQQYARVGRKYWYPHNTLSERLPVEWNHWWSYEDRGINETVFRENVRAAVGLGMELCTLDAGWFGPSEARAEWYDYRGDWDQVNHQRFPNGIRVLSDEVHSLGMAFGLWCEIEGLGKRSRLAQEHPGFAALRAGEWLGYVCLGNPEAQAWAYKTLCRLIREHGCDWIKLDFNLDPGAGCNRSDHGHNPGDGLYAHYQGYYRVLEQVRRAYPEVVLENCSSGGLRIDLGILKNTHLTFLSDPDWPVHSLQVFWGATTMLAPDACLHWSFSEWLGESLADQRFNPHSPNLTQRQLDYQTRIAMLGALGFSQKLPDLPEWVARRLAYHIRVYQQYIRRFVRHGKLYRLTGQPRRDGSGERWCAFQYSLPTEDQHLLFVFCLPGAEKEKVIRLLCLQPDQPYRITDLEGRVSKGMRGEALMVRGLPFTCLEEEDSRLLLISGRNASPQQIPENLDDALNG